MHLKKLVTIDGNSISRPNMPEVEIKSDARLTSRRADAWFFKLSVFYF